MYHVQNPWHGQGCAETAQPSSTSLVRHVAAFILTKFILYFSPFRRTCKKKNADNPPRFAKNNCILLIFEAPWISQDLTCVHNVAQREPGGLNSFTQACTPLSPDAISTWEMLALKAFYQKRSCNTC